ncbi:MAG: hypothetical protein AAGI07_08635 [Bacteroidota bacterium]
MMRSILKVIFFSIIVSCGSTADQKSVQEEDPLKAEVIAIHDEAMAKMGTMMSLEQQLKEVISTTDATLDSTQIKDYEKSIQELSGAHDAMMEWMRNFSKTFPHETLAGDDHKGHQMGTSENGSKRTEEETKRLLEVEKEKAIALRDRINKSISNAELLIKD